MTDADEPRRSRWPALAAIVGGLVVGVGSAVWVLKNGELLGDSSKDFWFGNDRAGSVAADPYTRGIVASIGLLALNKSETIYFHRYKDEEGRPLREGCEYELRGGSLPTRWWSITIYAPDEFLPMNDARAFSIDASQVVVSRNGEWTARIGPERGEAANWISTAAAGEFSLALRMYNPEEAAVADAMSIPFPTIATIGCDGGSS